MEFALTIAFYAIPIALAGLGVYVSMRPPSSRTHTWLIVGFIFLGVSGVAVGIWKESENKKNIDKQNQSIENLQISLNKQKEISEGLEEALRTSHLSQEFMKGQLSSIGKISSNIKSEISNQDRRETYAAIEKLAKATLEKREITKNQLCSRTRDLVKKMYEFETKYDLISQNSDDKWFKKKRSTVDPEQRIEYLESQNLESSQIRRQALHEFKTTILGEALYLRNELLNNIENPPEAPLHQLVAFDGMLAGVNPVSGAASYLETLAKIYCLEPK